MPAAAMTPEERELRSSVIFQAQIETGLSLNALAEKVALAEAVNVNTMQRNFRRWTGPAREGAVDGAPDHILKQVRSIPAMATALPERLTAAAARPDLPGEVRGLLRAAACALSIRAARA